MLAGALSPERIHAVVWRKVSAVCSKFAVRAVSQDFVEREGESDLIGWSID